MGVATPTLIPSVPTPRLAPILLNKPYSCADAGAIPHAISAQTINFFISDHFKFLLGTKIDIIIETTKKMAKKCISICGG
jgi:hypothetical protein